MQIDANQLTNNKQSKLCSVYTDKMEAPQATLQLRWQIPFPNFYLVNFTVKILHYDCSFGTFNNL
jgi:hypothetical protein